jgi:hypothetical protein
MSELNLSELKFVGVYGGEGIKYDHDTYIAIKELGRRLEHRGYPTHTTGNKGISQAIRTGGKDIVTRGPVPFENIVVHIFTYLDFSSLERLFYTINKIVKDPNNKAKVIIYDEPGWNPYDRLNVFLTELMDRGFIGGEVFDIIVPTWSLNEIMDFVKVGIGDNIYIRKEEERNNEVDSEVSK